VFESFIYLIIILNSKDPNFCWYHSCYFYPYFLIIIFSMKLRKKLICSILTIFLAVCLFAPSGCRGFKSENKKLKEEVTDISTENKKLKKELDNLKGENSNMHERLAQLNLQISELQNEIQGLKKDLASFKSQIKGVEKRTKRS
jgi:septal ring factor EnvC (AmiA/AmiB activator)